MLGLELAGMVKAAIALLTFLSAAFALGKWWGGRAAEARVQNLIADKAQAVSDGDSTRRELSEAKGALARHEAVRTALLSDETDLWTKHAPAEVTTLQQRLSRCRAKIITVANLKGGVGKTTVTANLAAYFETNQRRGQRVLIIDLDYQGSLSAMLLQAAGLQLDGSGASLADRAMSGTADPQWLVTAARSLHPLLRKARLVTSNYQFSFTENRLMLQWLLKEAANDPRFSLAELLLSSEVQDNFDLVLIDTAPRLTIGTVAALATSHYFIAPTMLNTLAVETMKSTLYTTRQLMIGLNPSLRLAGVVATMTYGEGLTDTERDARALIVEALDAWQLDRHIFARNIPRKNAISNNSGSQIAYLENGEIKSLFDQLGDELSERIGI